MIAMGQSMAHNAISLLRGRIPKPPSGGIVVIVAVIGALCDFFKPALDLMWLYLLIGIVCIVSVNLFPRLVMRFGSANDARNLRWAGRGSIVIGIGLIGGSWLFPGQSANGLLANTITPLADAQSEMLRTTRRIEASTARTASAMEGAAQNASEIERETSADARKELANLGSSFTANSFYRAAMLEDERLVQLFIEGGMRINRNMFSQIINDRQGSKLSLFAPYASAVEPDACDFERAFSNTVDLYYLKQRSSKSWAFVRQACGQAELKAQFERLREIYQNEQRAIDEMGKTREQQLADCEVAIAEERYIDCEWSEFDEENYRSSSAVNSEQLNRIAYILSDL